MNSDASRAGGWRFDLESQGALPDTCLSTEELKDVFETEWDAPEEIDPRPWFPVMNQENEGSCQGCTLRGIAGSIHYWISKKWKEFSADAAYYLTQKRDGIKGDNGSTIAGGVWVATNIGMLPAEFMPYTPKYNPQDLPVNYAELCAPYKIKRFAPLRSVKDVYEWLSKGLGGVSWGIRWGVKLNNNGEVKWSAGIGGGHATAITGYLSSRNASGIPTRFICTNSWGTSWGLNGHMLWPQDELAKALADSFTVCYGLSDMTVPKPRKLWADSFPS